MCGLFSSCEVETRDLSVKEDQFGENAKDTFEYYKYHKIEISSSHDSFEETFFLNNKKGNDKLS